MRAGPMIRTGPRRRGRARVVQAVSLGLGWGLATACGPGGAPTTGEGDRAPSAAAAPAQQTPARPVQDAPAPATDPHDTGPSVGASLYDLVVPLEDQDGRRVGIDTFRGHPTLVAMFYASCPYVCPALIADIARIVDGLSPAARERVRILMVSFDPSRDDPQALRDLAGRHHLDLQRWKLTRPGPDDVRTVAAVLGIQYRPTADGEMNHSSIITLVDGSGRIVDRIDGIGSPQDRLLQRLGQLEDLDAGAR